MWIDQGHAGVIDSHLFPKEYNLLLGSIVFALDPEPSVCTIGRPTPPVGRGVLSERDHVEHRGADVLGPGLGKCDSGLLFRCHDVFQGALIEVREYTLTAIRTAS